MIKRVASLVLAVTIVGTAGGTSALAATPTNADTTGNAEVTVTNEFALTACGLLQLQKRARSKWDEFAPIAARELADAEDTSCVPDFG